MLTVLLFELPDAAKLEPRVLNIITNLHPRFKFVLKMKWAYALQSTVGTQVAHVITGIKGLDYDDLVKAILSSSEEATSEWKGNMEVRAHSPFLNNL